MTRQRTSSRTPSAASVVGASTRAGLPPEDTIWAILQERVEIGRQSTGIVAVVIDKVDHRLVAFGRPDTRDERPLDGETVFEIGSITKVLTALLLTEMVTRGEVAMSDPLARHLPDSIRVPDYQDKPITLLDLATYTAGLPMWPDGFQPDDSLNPYATYTVEQLCCALTGHTLRHEPGTPSDDGPAWA